MASPVGRLQRLYGRSGKTALAREITEMTWARFFDGYELVHGLVAESNGALLGLTALSLSSLDDHDRTYLLLAGSIHGRSFAPQRRRRALIEEVYRQAKLSGCGRVYWHTQETNRTARALYDKGCRAFGVHQVSQTVLTPCG